MIVREDEVGSYGYQRKVFADGRNAMGKFTIQVSVCRQNPRAIVHWDGQSGQTMRAGAGATWPLHECGQRST